MRVLEQDGNSRVLFNHNDVTDEITIVHEQDVSGFLDRMKRERENADERWKQGVKEEWVKYCSIPNVVAMELKNKGIDIFNPDHEKRMLQEINRNYPYLKYVEKTHE